MKKALIPILFQFFLFHLSASAQTAKYATAGNGSMKNYICWFDWAGKTVANNSITTFTTEDGLNVIITFSNITGPAVNPYIMNTWSGSILWQLYDFTNANVKPALFSQNTINTVSFTMNITATRDGIPTSFTFIAADAEASDETETTTFTTNGSAWRTIEFFRNSSQTNNPLAGCGTQNVQLSQTYGGATQTGQNPILATDANGTLTISTTMSRTVQGGMAVAFGIFSPIDRGDLPASYTHAQHRLTFSTINSCNFNYPFPSINQNTSLHLGTVPGDADGAQTLNDNTLGVDEEAISTFPAYNSSGNYTIAVPLKNTTGSNAFLRGWFDYNRNGTFDNNEGITITVPNGSTSASMTWSGLPSSLPNGSVNDFGFRFRISSNVQEASSIGGYARDGEVEDYLLSPLTVIPSVVQPNFLIPDTVCVGTPVNITNTSTGATNYFWNFCVADINQAPDAVNIGNPGGLSSPVFIDYAYYNGNHYGFLINYHPGKLIRLNFGNSLLNIPTSTDLGNFGGILPSGSGTEGIQIVFNEEKWYAIIVGGTPAVGNSPRLVKIDFGLNLTNPNPIATNWGNIGNMLLPIDLHVFTEGGNWYGFTVNAENNTITRFNFTNSFNNIPTAINLGNVGNLQYPTGIYAINDNGTWRVFIVNGGDNTRLSSNCSLTRLDFGSSLLNIPVGVNLGNPGNLLQHPRDLTIMKLCNQVIGYVVNGNPNFNDILKIDFNNDLLAIPNITSLGNIGNFNFPHSISKLFRIENDVYGFITNVANNTITRLKFNGCNTSSISNSNQFNPPQISYSNPGTYFVNLTIDDGLPTQSTICKQVVVVSGPPGLTQNLSTCKGDNINIGSSRKFDSYLWSTGATTDSINVTTSGIYWVETKEEKCYTRDTIIVQVIDRPIIELGNDTSICKGQSIILNAGQNLQYYQWNDLTSEQTLNVHDAGIYYVTVTNNGCSTSDTIAIFYHPDPIFKVMPDTSVCNNSLLNILTQADNEYDYNWTPSTGLSSTNISNPLVVVSDTMIYRVTAKNEYNCKSTDSITIYGLKSPIVDLGEDTMICPSQSFLLNAGNIGASYSWSNGTTSQTNLINNSGMYHVSVNINNCITKDSIFISVKQKPHFILIPENAEICENETIFLKATGGDTYNWFLNGISLNNYDSIIAVIPNLDNLYSVIINELECGYKDTLYTDILIKSKPDITISTSNEISCSKPISQLLATGGIEYVWTPAIAISNVSIPNPVVSPSADTWYKVQVKGLNGCNNIDSIKVITTMSPNEKFYVPSAFSPNNDGKNDCLKVKYAGQVNNYNFMIFNRWGEKVFKTNDLNDCWDGYVKGKRQSNEVFMFILKASTNCGDIFEKGTITLIK